MWRLAVVFLVVIPAAALTALVVGLRYWTRQPLGHAAEARRAEERRIKDAVKQLEDQFTRQERQGPGSPDS
jgi:hypothetical protein